MKGAASARCHPLLKLLWEGVRQRGISYNDLARRSGVSAHAIRNWRTGTSPTISNLEACLNTVGLKLIVKPVYTPRFK